MIDLIKSRYLQLLTEVISFESVSTLGNPEEIKKTISWYQKLFTENDFDVEIIKGYDNPVIFSEVKISDNYPTVLIYGHYDVQPALASEWGYNPFSLTEKNERVYGRGVADNKGQSLIHIATAIYLLKNKKLAYNVKFIIEGNEETGSPKIKNLLKKHKEKFKSDIILLSDGDLLPTNPIIEVSMRGVINTTLTLTTADHEVHSGSFGGIMPNAAYEAGVLISKLYDKNRKININFYDDIEDIKSAKHRRKEIRDGFIKRMTGAKKTFTENGQSLATQVGLRPSVEITSFSSGYIGEGYRNSIPNQAVLKLNIRLAPGQESKKVMEEFENFVDSNLPDYVGYDIHKPEGAEGATNAIIIDYDNESTRHIEKLLEKVYGSEVLYSHQGAVVPIAKHLNNILDGELVVVPLANHDCNMHAVDENFDLQILEKALRFSNEFLTTAL